MIICTEPDLLKNQHGIRKVRIHSRKILKEVFNDFITSPGPDELVLYNNRNAEKLLNDFISLFKYIEAAGGVVRNIRGERLFIFRSGKWDLPKGKIEKSETPSQAALREVSEETGLHGQTINTELPSTWHIYEQKGKKILKRTYWFAMNYAGNEQVVPQLEEDITEAAWVTVSEIGKVLSNTYASLQDLIQNDIHLADD